VGVFSSECDYRVVMIASHPKRFASIHNLVATAMRTGLERNLRRCYMTVLLQRPTSVRMRAGKYPTAVLHVGCLSPFGARDAHGPEWSTPPLLATMNIASIPQ
jgi:hypothetical protein